MSNNAVDAYNSGERPLSRWTKTEILREIATQAEGTGLNMGLVGKLNLPTLKAYFLKYSSWHHTSSRYNKTTFYRVVIPTNITNTFINSLIEQQKQESLVKYPVEIKYGYIKVEEWGGTRKHPCITGYDEQFGIVKGNYLYYLFSMSSNRLYKYKVDANKVVKFECYETYKELKAKYKTSDLKAVYMKQILKLMNLKG